MCQENQKYWNFGSKRWRQQRKRKENIIHTKLGKHRRRTTVCESVGGKKAVHARAVKVKKVNKSILKCFITPSFKAKLLLNGLLDPSFNLPFALAPHKILWDSGVSRSIYTRCALQHQEPKIQNQSRKRAPKKTDREWECKKAMFSQSVFSM